MNTTPKPKQQQPPAQKADMKRKADQTQRDTHVEHQEWHGEGVVSENHTD